jgi:hypothetical protein
MALTAALLDFLRVKVQIRNLDLSKNGARPQYFSSNKCKGKQTNMSWDIVIFNSPDKIKDIETFDADKLKPTDFDSIFEKNFSTIKKEGNQREIVGKNFSIDYFISDKSARNKMVSLDGENALYELVFLAKKSGWQIFDTGNGEIIDLDDPTKNRYPDFQKYLKQVLKK